ncbi:N-6 DNA methylase, partial [Actinomycetota bacterium]
ADFVMANPPFNVDEIDADKIKNDPRLPFGLPGVNKKGKVSNGNYVWISYFYSYLTEQGRAGFVMSSQASSAGGREAKVREKLIDTGHVDIMISIRSNFFYTRAVPCELWFFNKSKPAEFKDKVLMIDARNVFRKVTRKIYDFSPEQLQNILSIIWLYRGENKRFHDLLANYISATLHEAVQSIVLAQDYTTVFAKLNNELQSFLNTLPKDGKQLEIIKELADCMKNYANGSQIFTKLAEEKSSWWEKQNKDTIKLAEAFEELEPLAEKNNKLIKETELMHRLVNRLIDQCLNAHKAKESDKWDIREIANFKKQVEVARDAVADQLKLVRYFNHQAEWLVERFPEEKLRDVEGLVKLVDKAGEDGLKANNWSLMPGRYVGVAPEEIDPDFDFDETMKTIHSELEELNAQSDALVQKISENFKKIEV